MRKDGDKQQARIEKKRARFEERIARTSAADAAKRAEAQRKHDVLLEAVGKKMATGSPMKFLTLKVTVHDGTVYRTSDARPIGPLAEASAQITDLKPIMRRTAGAMMLGFPEKQAIPRVLVTVKAGGPIHKHEVEGRLGISNAQADVRRFNAASEVAATER